MSINSVSSGNRSLFTGTSADTKPTTAVLPGSLFIETDTLNQFILGSDYAWHPYFDKVGMMDGSGNAIQSSQGALYSAMFIWQPSTLSYIHATADASGNLNVTSAGGGGGGTVTANQGTAGASAWLQNLAQYGGTAVGATNAIHVQPGTGATFPVSGTVATTQSGTWSVGRTWTLASGSDSVTATISGTPSVSVSNFPATQPVSGTVAATQSGTWNINSITTLPSLPAGSNAIGSVSVSNFPATQPISGTVAISGTPTVSVTSSVLPTNAAQETAGQLQNVADVLEQLLIEVRVTNALLSGLSQPRPDDPELIRSDLINSLQ